MPEKLQVGIVGASVSGGGNSWGERAHIPGLKALPDFEIRAVCTAHEETAKASAEAFGAEFAYDDINQMVARDDLDLIVVSVRVPNHRELVMAALAAGKNTFCEWPLGANLAEAEEMSLEARQHGLHTMVGLQARSDPALLYARDLIQQGKIGEVLTANLTVFGAGQVERPSERVWAADRKAGANTLTIAAGHNLDTLCFLLGEFVEVTGRVTTRVKEWRLSDTGGSVKVDAPDSVSFAGSLQSGAEVSVHVVSMPAAQGGVRLTIFGHEGTLSVGTAMMTNIGPNLLSLAAPGAAPEDLTIPDSYRLVPEGTPPGPPLNVAQAYARFADAANGSAAQNAGGMFDADFDLAVRRHRLLDAVERSSNEGRSIHLP